MERFFGRVEGEKAYISPDKAHHLVRVLRAKKGDKVEIADTGELYLCEIKSLEPLELAVLESLYKPKPLPFTVVLAFSLKVDMTNSFSKKEQSWALTNLPHISRAARS